MGNAGFKEEGQGTTTEGVAGAREVLEITVGCTEADGPRESRDVDN